MNARNITPQIIDQYRHDGFVRVPNVISKDEAAYFYQAARRLVDEADAKRDAGAGRIFAQLVNVWQHDPIMCKLTCHANIGQVAQVLAGGPLRLWHDHILCKMPHNKAATEFHQDQPYWPHANCADPISAWIALCDVPVERGCMTFIPESHRHTHLPAQNLADSRSLLSICPELEYAPRVTVPLKAGDCTFHHGRCAHMATANLTDLPRIAHVVIFMAQSTTYRKQGHIVTDPLELEDGDPLDGPLFPAVSSKHDD
jgi:phytanoyl-CoA hydroxylase